MIIQHTSAPLAITGIERPRVAQPIADASPASKGEVVTISSAARETFAAARGSDFPPGEHPLEYYAVPQWEIDIRPVALSGNPGERGVEGLYEAPRNLVQNHKQELDAYNQLLDGHIKAVLQKEGINTLAEYHQALIVDKDRSEQIRQSVVASIAGDARITNLIQVLGISLPS